MAKKLGSDYRLFVRGSDGTTFTQPQGQGNLTVNRSKNFGSSATKDTEGVDTQTPGLRSLSLKQDFVPDLPDAAGFERIDTLDKSSTAEVYQIRKKPFAVGDVIFECSMYAALDGTEFEQGNPVKSSLTLQPAAQPTVDKLA